MNVQRMLALIAIYMLGCAGWWTLGIATQRSTIAEDRLGEAVESLWGAPLVQNAPEVLIVVPGAKEMPRVLPTRSEVRVDLHADPRRKGLIWYPTFVCGFAATYTLRNEEAAPRRFRVHFAFPAAGATYDGFEFRVGAESALAPVDTRSGIDREVELGAGESREVHVAYRTRGTAEWRYRAGGSMGRVRDLDMVVQTDFRAVDFGEGALSPMSAEPDGDGMVLVWKAADLITTQVIGIVTPCPLNAGPLTTRITFFAPVCLLFFFVTIITIGIVYGIPIHPMHYLFVTGGFFAFHLLLAYLVDHFDVHASFAASAAVSVALVTAYLGAALGPRFPIRVCVAGQLFFLVLFSYSFFLEGATGLTVALGSVGTLAALMKVTARVNWEEVFAGKPAFPAPADAPA